jgi:hypothetical protein
MLPQTLTLDDLRMYLHCSLAWFLEKRAGLEAPRRVAALAGEAVREGLAVYYTGEAERLGTAVARVWQGWCAGWGEEALYTDLLRYARDRAAILAQFEKGAFRKFDGERYQAPQLSAKYRDLMHDRGLTALGRKLDELAAVRGLALDDPSARPGGARVGSALGDAFADSLVAAERMSRQAAHPLPAPEVVLGLQIPAQVDLSPTLRLTAFIDLVSQAAGGGEAAVQLEVHDFEPLPFVRAGLAARDVRVLAALLAQPATEALAWGKVERVIYRHWPSGEVYAVPEGNVGYLLAVVASAARGMRHQVIAPRALTGYDDCRGCRYRQLCWSESGWQSLPLLDPGRLAYAERLREMVGKLKATLGADRAASRRLGEALEVLEGEFVRLDPDLADMLAVTQAAWAVAMSAAGAPLATGEED